MTLKCLKVLTPKACRGIANLHLPVSFLRLTKKISATTAPLRPRLTLLLFFNHLLLFKVQEVNYSYSYITIA